MNEKVEKLKTKGKEYLDKAEVFVEDHSGVIFTGILGAFAVGVTVLMKKYDDKLLKQTEKFYAEANQDIRTALMCELVKNSNNNSK